MITVRTANCGLHFWFKMPPVPLKNSAGKLAAGIDTRGAGGYVIAPGCSLPDGRQWRLRSPITIVEFIEQLSFQVFPPPPSWIVDALQGARGGSLIKFSAEQALDRECQRVRDAPIGTRNDTLNTAAFAVGQLVCDGAFSRAVAEQALDAAAAAAGLEPAEIKATVASGLNAGLKKAATFTPGGNGTGQPVWAEIYKDGSPRPTYRNAQIAMRSLGLTFEHDTFHRRKTISGQPIGRVRRRDHG
jgi:hypothetical protein